ATKWPVDKEGDCDYNQEDDKSCRERKPEELLDAEEREDRDREPETRSKDEDEYNHPYCRERTLPGEPDLRGGGRIRNLLDCPYRAEIPAEVPPEEESQEEEDTHSDRGTHEGKPDKSV